MSIKAVRPFNTEPHYNIFLLNEQSHISHIVLMSGISTEVVVQGMNNLTHLVWELCCLHLLQSERTLPWRWWRAMPHPWQMGINGWNGGCSWVGASSTLPRHWRCPFPPPQLTASGLNLGPMCPQTSWIRVSSSCPARVCLLSTHCYCLVTIQDPWYCGKSAGPAIRITGLAS